MLRVAGLLFVLLFFFAPAHAQDTPTPTATATDVPTTTPTPDTAVYATIAPASTDSPGQATRFDYTITAGEKYIGDVLTWVLYSLWGMFFFGLFVLYLRYRRR